MTIPRERSRRPRKIRQRLWRLALILLTLALPLAAWAEDTPSKEYQVKAAFLLRFLQFVEWPESSFATAEAPIRIGILGDDPFGTVLDRMAAAERVRNRPLMVVRSGMTADLRDCHMIFVAGSERERLVSIAQELPMEAVLTISDIDGFAERGGMIRFFLADKKVRFEVNPSVAQRQHLKLSAQLLSLGRIVGPSTSSKEP